MSASRVIPAADGLTVHEPARDLTWTREDVGGGRLTYDQAVAAVAALNEQLFAGFADWRLPTIEELFLLADRSRFSPAIDTDAFPTCASEWYWSGTLDAEDPAECAWVVYFGYGSSGNGSRDDLSRVRAVRDHYDAINATLGQHRIQPPQSLSMDIGLVIKGKKSLASMQDAVGTAAANAKIAASQQADRVRACIHVLEMEMGDYAALFPDRVALCASKAPEDLLNLVTARIAEHQQHEQARRDAEREKIRAEEEARAKRLQEEAEAARLAQEKADREAEEARERALRAEQEQAARAAGPVPQDVLQPVDPAPQGLGQPSGPTFYAAVATLAGASASMRKLRLGEINALIAPLSISADGLAELGFQPVGTERAAKLYDAARLPAMVDAMQRHLYLAIDRPAA